MKPAMELVKVWRERGKVLQLASQAEVPGVEGSWRGLYMAADELEAWLRETDEKLVRLAKHDRYYVDNEWLRRELLGTTRSEGEK